MEKKTNIKCDPANSDLDKLFKPNNKGIHCRMRYWTGKRNENSGYFTELDCLAKKKDMEKLTEESPTFLAAIIEDGQTMILQTDNIYQIVTI